MVGQWLLLILYGLVGLANVVRSVQAWIFSRVLTETSLALPVLGGVYLVFGLIFLVSGMLYFRKPGRRTRWFARGLAVVYQVVVWLIQLIGDRSAYARRLWGRDLILTLVFLVFVFVVTESRFRLRR